MNAAGLIHWLGIGFGRINGTPGTRNGRLKASRLPRVSVT